MDRHKGFNGRACKHCRGLGRGFQLEERVVLINTGVLFLCFFLVDWLVGLVLRHAEEADYFLVVKLFILCFDWGFNEGNIFMLCN